MQKFDTDKLYNEHLYFLPNWYVPKELQNCKNVRLKVDRVQKPIFDTGRPNQVDLLIEGKIIKIEIIKIYFWKEKFVHYKNEKNIYRYF